MPQSTELDLSTIDHQKALLLIDASIQAYNAFEQTQPSVCQVDRIKVPAGYEFVEAWTGVDSVFSEDQTVEIYGIVFRSTAAPHVYVFAFRGTDSFLDMLDDAGVEHAAFAPHALDSVLPANVHVEDGFFRVYRTSDGQTPSMQTQLFALIDKYNSSAQPIAELWITGHSLGSALSELFTFDVAISAPTIKASNYNFACPRLGNENFVTGYQQQPAQRSQQTRTVRIQNTHDLVPCVPLRDTFYRHIMPRHLIAFTKSEQWSEVDLKFVLHNHSALNYQAVLQCAFSSPDNVCVNDALISPAGYTIRSRRPDPRDVCRFW